MTFARAQLAVGTPAITLRVATAPPGEAAEIDDGSSGERAFALLLSKRPGLEPRAIRPDDLWRV